MRTWEYVGPSLSDLARLVRFDVPGFQQFADEVGGAITFSHVANHVANQACEHGGICAAAGTALTKLFTW